MSQINLRMEPYRLSLVRRTLTLLRSAVVPQVGLDDIKWLKFMQYSNGQSYNNDSIIITR
jgi:hypothetical protein